MLLGLIIGKEDIVSVSGLPLASGCLLGIGSLSMFVTKLTLLQYMTIQPEVIAKRQPFNQCDVVIV